MYGKIQESNTFVVEFNSQRMMVKDTDKGKMCIRDSSGAPEHEEGQGKDGEQFRPCAQKQEGGCPVSGDSTAGQPPLSVSACDSPNPDVYEEETTDYTDSHRFINLIISKIESVSICVICGELIRILDMLLNGLLEFFFRQRIILFRHPYVPKDILVTRFRDQQAAR